MGYYLLDHGRHVKWSTGRNGPVVGGIIHCTAGLDVADEVRQAGGEWAGIDRSAERTAEWCAGTTTASSWHDGTDWDSHIALLPLHYRAWHCRGGPSGFWRDYNDALWGLEISKTDMTWGDEHEGWVGPTLSAAAAVAGRRARQAGFPIRHITRSQLDAAIRAGDPSMGGFVGHRQLDPDRRSDPGSDFPWGRFLDLARTPTGLTMADVDDIIARLDKIEERLSPAALADAAATGVYQQRTNIGGLESSIEDPVNDKQVQLHTLLRRIRFDGHRLTGLLSALAADNDRILAAIADAEGLTVDEVRAVLAEAVSGLTVTFEDQEQS